MAISPCQAFKLIDVLCFLLQVSPTGDLLVDSYPQARFMEHLLPLIQHRHDEVGKRAEGNILKKLSQGYFQVEHDEDEDKTVVRSILSEETFHLPLSGFDSTAKILNNLDLMKATFASNKLHTTCRLHEMLIEEQPATTCIDPMSDWHFADVEPWSAESSISPAKYKMEQCAASLSSGVGTASTAPSASIGAAVINKLERDGSVKGRLPRN
eukprot:6426412-Amphidinium_carterae.1